MQTSPDSKKIYEALMEYKTAFSTACTEYIPDYMKDKKLDTDEYIERLKQYHPF